MLTFIYRAVHRDPYGTLGPTLYEQTIEAATVEEAIALAQAVKLDIAAIGANAVYVIAAYDGRAILTLHLPDAD